MNCALCNGVVREERGAYSFRSKILGEVLVPGITYEECLECGDKSLSLASSVALREYVCRKEQSAIAELPASDLITATEAAEILNVTKQAFSKNPKIKRGFIYFVKVGGRKLYFKKSVELFKETNDGRFRLTISCMAWNKLLCINGVKKKKKKQATWETNISRGKNMPLSSTKQSKLVNSDNEYIAEA